MNARRAALRLRGLSKRFGYTWALRGVTLDLEQGETLAMVGPNGAGKTTLLKILAALYTPTSGFGEILGHPLGPGAEGIRRRTGLLADKDYLYDQLTGRENLKFAVRMAGRSLPPVRLDDVLGRVGLEEAAGRRVRTYSTGMRKRLSLGRLLLQDGDLILLDEPYAGLDREGVALVDRMVSEWHDAGRTVILASHQPEEAVRTADRTVLMRRGHLGELPAGSDSPPTDSRAGEPPGAR